MRRYLALVFLCFLTAAAFAQQAPEKPNFTGIWNLDLAKSSFGGLEAPQSARYLIRQLGVKIEMQYEQDGHTTRIDVVPDGEEHLLETEPDSENLARVYWSSAVLVFEGRIRPLPSSNAIPVKWTSRWTLSPDKKVLTIDRHISTERGNVDQKVVFNKQTTQQASQAH